MGESEFKGNKSAPVKNSAKLLGINLSSFFTCSLPYSLIEPMYFMADILLFVFLFQSIN